MLRGLMLIILMLLGAMECFAGYKFARVSVYIWGFLTAAVAAVLSAYRLGNVPLSLLLLFGLGLVCSLLAWRWYSVGVFLQIGTLTAAAAYLTFRHVVPAVLAGAAAGICTVFFLRESFIIATAAGGSVIILDSAYAMMGVEGSYLLAVILWVLITLAGVLCQWITTDEYGEETDPHFSRWKWRKEAAWEDTMTFSERKYPGLQRAYRNYCIRCGYELGGNFRTCPRCGFRLED